MRNGEFGNIITIVILIACILYIFNIYNFRNSELSASYYAKVEKLKEVSIETNSLIIKLFNDGVLTGEEYREISDFAEKEKLLKAKQRIVNQTQK